jgi:hypothetical protein
MLLWRLEKMCWSHLPGSICKTKRILWNFMPFEEETSTLFWNVRHQWPSNAVPYLSRVETTLNHYQISTLLDCDAEKALQKFSLNFSNLCFEDLTVSYFRAYIFCLDTSLSTIASITKIIYIFFFAISDYMCSKVLHNLGAYLRLYTMKTFSVCCYDSCLQIYEDFP